MPCIELRKTKDIPKWPAGTGKKDITEKMRNERNALIEWNTQINAYNSKLSIERSKVINLKAWAAHDWNPMRILPTDDYLLLYEVIKNHWFRERNELPVTILGAESDYCSDRCEFSYEKVKNIK